jgi:hypothetical protein
MIFQDSILRQHYERVISLMSGIPLELRPVCALLDTYAFFRQAEGEQAPRVREAFYHLSDPDLRPALRQWFRFICPNETNPTAMKSRQLLSEIIGETL